MSAGVVRRVDDAERRARLARRHALAPGCRVADPVAAARATVGLHATEPASVPLAALARCEALTLADVERALYTERTLVKALVMRRTLFAVTRDQLPVVTATAGPRVAHSERRNLLTDVTRAGAAAWLAAGAPDDGAADDGADGMGAAVRLPDAGGAAPRHAGAPPARPTEGTDTAAAADWLQAAGAAVLEALADGEPRSLDELRDAVALVRGKVQRGTGRWAQSVGVAPRVLSWLCARGLVVRATPLGHWRLSRLRWASMDGWLGAPLPVLDPEAAATTLVRWWLERYGPGTTEDLRWWLGGTLGVVRPALEAAGAVPVALGDGTAAWLAPDDVEPPEPVDPWVALLPVLDQSLMGWKGRGFTVGAHAARIFDRVGNGGPTAWVDGRIVGSWHQDEAGAVELVPFEPIPATAREALAAEGERVRAFCGGDRVVAPWRPAQP